MCALLAEQAIKANAKVFVIATLVDGVAGAAVRDRIVPYWPRFGLALCLCAAKCPFPWPFPFGAKWHCQLSLLY